jgi:hypothetical protein
MCDPPLCLVCRGHILTRADNCSLGNYAEYMALLAVEPDAGHSKYSYCVYSNEDGARLRSWELCDDDDSAVSQQKAPVL